MAGSVQQPGGLCDRLDKVSVEEVPSQAEGLTGRALSDDIARRWSAWANTAITDTPPDIYKGERVGAGSPASGYFGGSTVATDNVWIVDGRFLTEREWSKWEHRDDPPHSREGPPPG